ncbi:MAG: hypothetical protein WBN44_01015 [Woeseiaceae bacterium]
MRTQKTLLPLFAVSGGLAAVPSHALELGDITVESRLGQPLRASIAYALAPHEELSSSCVTLGLGASASGLPGVGRATVSIADGTILLTGKSPVREPMIATTVNVDCPYTPNLSREYLLFVDPAGTAYDSPPVASESAAAPATVTNAVAATPARSSSAPRRKAAGSKVAQTPIDQSSKYRVQPGDTLSQIVQRIENRSASLWPAVNAIFDANPDAFIDDDPNKLKAGSWLTIPGFLVEQSAPTSLASTADSGVDSAATSAAAIDTSVQGPADAVDTAAATDAAQAELVSYEMATPADSTSDLRPAAAASDNPFVDGAETSVTTVIEDTELEGPVTISTSPNVTTAVINTESNSTVESSSWLMWLSGAGLALIAALLLFGRLFRGRPVEAELPADLPQRRATDLDPTVSEAAPLFREDSGIEVVAHTDYTLEDDSPTAENLTLDADLVMGTGLDEGTEMEVAEDFGFATPTEIDLELPFEPEPTVPESDTGIFAADDDITSVMEGADSDIDEYDLSVVLDATKMPRPEDVTQRDLQAVEVEPIEDTEKTDAYSINTQVDLEILEQDYEYELTATQALNAEILRAAEELAADNTVSSDDYDVTSELAAATPLATVTELDVTAQLPSSHEAESSADETGIHEAATVEMPLAENDETAEMDIDKGKSGSKAV